MTTKATAETNHYLTYRLNGITYLPHYTKDCFVSPDYSAFTGIVNSVGDRFYAPVKEREYTAYELEKAGATKVAEELWTRAKHKEIL